MTSSTLHFRPDGSFRILYLSDFQETYEEFDPRTLRGVNAVLDAERPDLIVLCGDNCNGPRITDADGLRRYLGKMTAPFVTRSIPWCHVNGNHDYDAAVPMDEQLRIYQAVPGCLTQSVPGIPGTTNFMLPVRSSDDTRIAAAVWGLDTGNHIEDIRPGLKEEALRPGQPLPSSVWSIVRFEQLMWYWQTSVALEQAAGAPVPGVMAMHVSPWEFNYMRDYPEALSVIGNYEEPYGLGALNSGVFATLVQRGDVRCVCTGHTHFNTCQSQYCGVWMCNVGSAGYSAYGSAELRGGRIVDLNEQNPGQISTRMAYFRNYASIKE